MREILHDQPYSRIRCTRRSQSADNGIRDPNGRGVVGSGNVPDCTILAPVAGTATLGSSESRHSIIPECTRLASSGLSQGLDALVWSSRTGTGPRACVGRESLSLPTPPCSQRRLTLYASRRGASIPNRVAMTFRSGCNQSLRVALEIIANVDHLARAA